MLGCSETKTTNTDDIFFAVDRTLLNPAYIDSTLGISFCPPKGWNPLQDSTLKAARSRLENSTTNDDSLSFQLIQFFTNLEKSAFCSLTEVGSADSSETLISIAETYKTSLKSKFPNLEIRQGSFTTRGLNVVQFLIQLEEKILFKLIALLPNKKIVQLDYAIARTIYPNFIKHIESSIGSINTSLNEEKGKTNVQKNH